MREFHELVAALAELGLASDSYAEMINLLAATLYRVGELARALQSIEVGSLEWGRAHRQFNQAARLAQSLLVEFGLTPVSAARVAVPDRREKNRFTVFARDEQAD